MIGWAAVRQAANKAMAEVDVDRSQPCSKLEKELEDFLDDPITEYYGVGSEMSSLLVWQHTKRHNCQGLGEG